MMDNLWHSILLLIRHSRYYVLNVKTTEHSKATEKLHKEFFMFTKELHESASQLQAYVLKVQDKAKTAGKI